MLEFSAEAPKSYINDIGSITNRVDMMLNHNTSDIILNNTTTLVTFDMSRMADILNIVTLGFALIVF